MAANAEPGFASRRMVFVELCPYASQRFNLPSLRVEELARSETGFQTAAEITAILLKEARPHLLLVNGASALANFHALYGPYLAVWESRAYASASSGRKTMALPRHPPWVRQRPANRRLSILAYTANAQLPRGDRPDRHCWERVRPFCISIE